MTKPINKLIQDGKVAVLFAPSFGSGWSTWNPGVPEILFDPAIVEFVEKDQWDELKVYVELKYPGLYTGSIDDLSVQWVPEGAEFVVNEYDGSESIRLKDEMNWLVA